MAKGLVLIWATIVGAIFAWFPSGDYGPAVVSWVAPSADSSDVDPDAAIMVTFGDGIDSASVRINSFWLSAANVAVEASAIYDERNRSVVLSPAIPLASGTKYMAAIAVDARDKAGNALTLSRRCSFTTRRDLEHGFGGPILIVTSDSRPFTKYYSEILRAEGIGSFECIELSQITDQLLDRFSLAILGEMPLSETQVAMFSKWVQRGGDLISMRPDKKLARLLGLEHRGASVKDGYLLIDTAADPGHGITGETIQFHGAADLYTRSKGVTEIARLYRDASNATIHPAITLREIGKLGGQAAAFSYDLARSIVYTRQGNPAWVGDERDGNPVIRPNDLFFGAKVGDEHPDWNDLQRIAIPVADKQQRLLVHLMNFMLEGKAPLLRLWYFPKGHKAVLVMAGDDHGTRNGSQRSFDRLKATEPEGCSLIGWECYRATSWIYTTSGLTTEDARTYAADGFDIGLHVNTGCKNVKPSAFSEIVAKQLYDFRTKYRDLPAQTGSRTHCLT
nr:Ig-like domain-containing protein [Sinorhizobium meliloti]